MLLGHFENLALACLSMKFGAGTVIQNEHEKLFLACLFRDLSKCLILTVTSVSGLKAFEAPLCLSRKCPGVVCQL